MELQTKCTSQKVMFSGPTTLGDLHLLRSAVDVLLNRSYANIKIQIKVSICVNATNNKTNSYKAY